MQGPSHSESFISCGPMDQFDRMVLPEWQEIPSDIYYGLDRVLQGVDNDTLISLLESSDARNENQEDIPPPVAAPAPEERPKRQRQVYSAVQLGALEDRFQSYNYIEKRERMELAQRINLDHKQIKVWFRNRRSKDRNKAKKEFRAVKAVDMGELIILKDVQYIEE